MALAADVARRIAGGFEEGYRAVSAPYETEGPPIAVTPFEPGTVTPGAIASKVILSIMSGARSRSNYKRLIADRNARAVRDDAELGLIRARTADLTRPRPMVDVNGQSFEVGPLTGDAAERALYGAPPAAEMTPYQKETIRQGDERLRLARETAERIRQYQEGAAARAAQSPSAVALNAKRSIEELDAYAAQVGERKALMLRPQIDALRKRVLAGDRNAAAEIGVDPAAIAALKEMRYHKEANSMVDDAIERYAKGIADAANVRAMRESEPKRRRLRSILERASGMSADGMDAALGPDFSQIEQNILRAFQGAAPE